MSKQKNVEKHPDCECHRKMGKITTCSMECFNCSGAKKVTTTTEKDGKFTIKKISIEF